MQGRTSRTGNPINRVKCVVNSCQYWDSENQCVAESIEVQAPGARSTEDTDCATFAPKG